MQMREDIKSKKMKVIFAGLRTPLGHQCTTPDKNALHRAVYLLNTMYDKERQ